MKTGFRCDRCGSRNTRTRTDGARRAKEVGGMIVRVHGCGSCGAAFLTVQRRPTTEEAEAILGTRP